MSLLLTKHSKSWNAIPKQCKQCIKAIYIKEDDSILYQCSVFGNFKRDCTRINTRDKILPMPRNIKG